ncbi:riboflavin synthase [Verrucomicrobiaceae bacterium R5-34]|uniref:Riboflavin synthase n=1 Tax=Oceaniferula flava TaxID=2800421 RepID=A0AAE2S991_9BACT|nr:riboflavin synthase [Oceaniferula flavus]MBK1829382.1 riboflavin synthase [Verrucomicrobiaceae bacterium R5-34]MBK1853610.1 riboflavin synthase [Oceaniferula flavus]MBM1134915.1 riboflavin synthase [Oceaniferula flavus]
MFTGLIEATGRVLSLEPRGEQARLVIELPFAQELADGESVAINGCCLTVVEKDATSASFDILRQTLTVTSLGGLQVGSLVNLERAMLAGGRFGGHFVQGHVDATGEIIDLSPVGNDHRLEISLPPEIHQLCIDKGSLAIDGISLTIAELTDTSGVFWIIPHTMQETHLQQAQVGQKVNLEADVIAKHVAKLVGK